MSANRSVQAAQRRRAGPPEAGRGPQASINSAQMFAKQGSNQNVASGRLQGAVQKQVQQQVQQQPQQPEKLSNVSKMTIPQAITLITLRLGAIESKLLNMPEAYNVNNGESGINTEMFQVVMTRLESLEKRSGTTSVIPELNLLKQQFETVKQTVVQTKGSSVALIKENVSLKTQIENVRKELAETKELLTNLQNITMTNSQKIIDLSKEVDVYDENTNENTNENIDETTGENTDELNLDDSENLDNQFTNLQDESEKNEIVGNNLKQLIESELNTGSINA
jgi:hypothetical protein